MAGGPSHLETFDPKPKLAEMHGKPMPESFTKGKQIAQLQNAVLKARGGSFEFKKWGKSGMELTDIFPHIGSVADDLCVVRSMKTEQINHDTAHAFFNTGSIIKGRPSMGSWLLYGLGSETENLPGYIVLTSTGRTGQQPISSRQWSSGVLPSKYQGIQFQSKGEAVHYIGNPEGVCQSTQRLVVEAHGQRLRHQPAGKHRLLHLGRAHPVARGLDHLVAAADEVQEALVVAAHRVAGEHRVLRQLQASLAIAFQQLIGHTLC